MEITFLTNVLIVVGLSAAVLYICHVLKVPVIVGFLITGVLAGPQGLALIADTKAVHALAEAGIIFLLFTLGIEFSFQNLVQFKKPVLIGGSLQVVFTCIAATLVALYAGLPLAESIFIGFVVSLSSTAIVMKILQERAEVETPHGSTVLGILIFQDIIVVPMILLVPVLAGMKLVSGEFSLSGIIPAILVVALIFAARRAMPHVLFRVTRTRSRELFLLTIAAICFGIAWLTHKAGLSLALGAFLAGLIISESEYSHEALGHILPFRDVFMSFFFISIGMLLNLKLFLAHPVLLLAIALGVLGLKSLLASAASGFTGVPIRTMLIAGLALGQIGEFSFVLCESGLRAGLLPAEHYQIFLAVSIITMIATPFMISGAPRFAELTNQFSFLRKFDLGAMQETRKEAVNMKDHLVIIGFGINGRNLARVARASRIPYVIIEMNPVVIREERARGEPIFYGDATKDLILKHANVEEARCLVIVINDPAATARITWLARKLNPRLFIIVRTRFLREIEQLRELGASEVIPEEFETSVEIFSRVMRNYLLPRDEIERLIADVRSEGYEMLRSVSADALLCTDIRACLPEVELNSVRLSEKSPLKGKSLAETEMRKKFRVTLMAVSRNGEVISNPAPDIIFQLDDILVLAGEKRDVAEVERLVKVS